MESLGVGRRKNLLLLLLDSPVFFFLSFGGRRRGGRSSHWAVVREDGCDCEGSWRKTWTSNSKEREVLEEEKKTSSGGHRSHPQIPSSQFMRSVWRGGDRGKRERKERRGAIKICGSDLFISLLSFSHPSFLSSPPPVWKPALFACKSALLFGVWSVLEEESVIVSNEMGERQIALLALFPFWKGKKK